MLAALAAVAAFAYPSYSFAVDPADCADVRMADLGWTDIAFTNATSKVILRSLGYMPKQTLLGLNVAYDAMKRGEIDVFLGNWRPAQDDEFKPYFDDGSVVPVGVNLTGAKYTLAVPKYVYDAGVHSFDDLASNAAKFDSKIYGIEPGTNKPLVDMIAANGHGLGAWNLVESSEAAMLAQVKRQTSNQGWIVFLGWQPHPMNTTMKMEYLAGGDKEFGPNFGGATVRTIERKGYPQACPNVTKFFTNLAFDIDFENEGMAMIMNGGIEPDVAAKKMMVQNPAKLSAWLVGVTTLDGKPALDAVNASLGTGQ
jgi:glycine betaine/proline transport system substrate-binding protein